MEVVKNNKGRVQKVTLYASELCKLTDMSAEELEAWGELIPHSDWGRPNSIGGVEKKFEFKLDELEKIKKYVKLLQKGMTVQQIPQIEARGFLDAYALLADDCPPEITPHMMRSYCVLLVYQNRGQRMLLAEDLAKKADIPPETAKRHIMFLLSMNLLRVAQNPRRWEFEFVPRALNRFFPS